MVAGDVEVRICDNVATTIDTNLTAMRVTAGASGHYLMTSIGKEKSQVVLVAITE